MQKFTAELIPVSGMNATYINIPFSVENTYGVKGRVKVKATIDGTAYRGSIAKMDKNAPHILVVTQAIRKSIGKSAGDKVKVILEVDKDERIVQIPDDLAKIFRSNKAEKLFFDSLSYTNQKEYVSWTESAKRLDTRQNRLQLTLKKLQAKNKNPSAKL